MEYWVHLLPQSLLLKTTIVSMLYDQHCIYTTCQHICWVCFTDAVVSFEQSAYEIDEDEGSVMVCVDSRVTGGFQTALTVSLSASNGTASEFVYGLLDLSKLH